MRVGESGGNIIGGSKEKKQGLCGGVAWRGMLCYAVRA